MKQFKNGDDVRLKQRRPGIISPLTILEINEAKVRCRFIIALPDGDSTDKDDWFDIKDVELIPYGKN